MARQRKDKTAATPEQLEWLAQLVGEDWPLPEVDKLKLFQKAAQALNKWLLIERWTYRERAGFVKGYMSAYAASAAPGQIGTLLLAIQLCYRNVPALLIEEVKRIYDPATIRRLTNAAMDLFRLSDFEQELRGCQQPLMETENEIS
jgi:hypothetical protein